MCCKSRRASLPVISSESDSSFLQEYIQQQQQQQQQKQQQNSSVSFWLNMKKSRQNQWQWKDGSPLDFSRWIAGEPRNTTSNNQNCTIAFKKGWKTENCSERHNTVCQKGKLDYFLPFQIVFNL